MKNIPPFLLLLGFPCLAFAQAAPSPAQRLAWTDNTRPPYLVIEGAPKSIASGYLAAYAAWLNRTVVWAEDFTPMDTWDGVRGGGWQLGPWGKWVAEVPGRRLVLSVPMLAGNWKLDGPARGVDAGIPVSLEKGAQGDYNKHYKALAEHLVQHGLGESVIRLGWEFNGGWYPWRAQKHEEAFIAYWQQIVRTMRSVPGTEKLLFCWNPTIGLQDSHADKAWPGDAFVDLVGVDVYDQTWLPDIYPLPPNATPEEIRKRQDKQWNENLNFDGKGRDGLPFWVAFSKKHGKPLAVCEWGGVSGGHGGGDNPAFIERMYAFITNPENNVYLTCYFDVNAPDGGHMLFSHGGAKPTEMPRAAEKFQELFSLPPK